MIGRASRLLARFSSGSQLIQGEEEASLLMAAAPGLRVVDLNRPRALNGLTGEMVDTLLPLARDWQARGQEGDVKIAVLRGVPGEAG